MPTKATKRVVAKRAPAKKAARKGGGTGTMPTRPLPRPADGVFGTVKANSIRVDDGYGAPPGPFRQTITPAVALDEESHGGVLRLRTKGKNRVRLTPTKDGGQLTLWDANGKQYALFGDSGNNDGAAGLMLRPGGGTPNVELWAGKNGGWFGLYDGKGKQQIVLDADAGDILLVNADCAEEFDVVEEDVEPGTVLVLHSDSGRLRTSYRSYDSTVAGVVSGAGAYRPGIVLDRKGPTTGRRPVALVGKVFCMVDATPAPVGPGSLLTTAELPGHAMAVVDKARAFGAVLGKALQGLKTGRGLIPILVALQ